jgi:predicted unusual protein kinase regulating ubiquinone biosynthesis (AarF/ABC1/UbiB family)
MKALHWIQLLVLACCCLFQFVGAFGLINKNKPSASSGRRHGVGVGVGVGADGSRKQNPPSHVLTSPRNLRSTTTARMSSIRFQASTPVLASPLFSSTVSLPFKTNRLSARKVSPRRLARAFSAASLSLLSSLSHPERALAAGSLATLRETIPFRKLFQAAISVWLVTVAVSTYRTKQRQTKDATSEWGRFAQQPGARARAISWLITRQSFLVLFSKLVRNKWRSQIREFAGRQFAQGLLQLGPLYIKLGQIVSCRKNLLGEEWITSMARLQDAVPARTGQEALDLAYTTLPGGQDEFNELFIDFDSTPLAAASLGQVHRATLRSNRDQVAVKVQRPFLKQIYDQDLELLMNVAKSIDKLRDFMNRKGGGVSSYSWTSIFQDAEAILYREIDYRAEAENGIRFNRDFGLDKGGQPMAVTSKARNNQTLPSAADWIRAPHVYGDISSERLLVMEFVPSIKITNTAKLAAANITDADKLDLADALARAYLRQFCCNLFFSTDPHPGNLGVEIMDNGKGGKPTPRLVFYDFGQAATLNQGQADGILDIIEAIIDTDVDRSIDAFLKMGVLESTDPADLDKVRSKVGENYRTGKIKANRKKLKRGGYKFKDDDDDKNSNSASLSDATTANVTASTKSEDLEVMSFFSLPAEYAFVARAITQMDGVGKGLDPDFDFISNSAPYIVEIKGTDKYLKEEATKLFMNFQKKVTAFQRSLDNKSKTAATAIVVKREL